ncbi:Crp/Fnr family transcriptional regulator [Paenibacillus marinisediminis]
MHLHRGEVLFHQGDTGPLYRVKSGLLKIIRIHEDGNQLLMNIIVTGEVIPHHSLVSPNPYHGTAIALVPCEIEMITSLEWYGMLAQDPEKYCDIAIMLQDKLKMMQQRIDQLTQVTSAQRLEMLQKWFDSYIAPAKLTDVLTQDEIAQFIGLRRETVNRLLRAQSNKLPAGPKNSK